MLSIAFFAAMLGIEEYVVHVEAHSAPGTPGFTIIGLPDRALAEASNRVRSAIVNSGFGYPAEGLLANLCRQRAVESEPDVRERARTPELPHDGRFVRANPYPRPVRLYPKACQSGRI